MTKLHAYIINVLAKQGLNSSLYVPKFWPCKILDIVYEVKIHKQNLKKSKYKLNDDVKIQYWCALFPCLCIR